MHRQKEISDLALEQYALGELSAEKEASMRAALEADTGLQARLQAILDSNRQILSDYPPSRMAGALRTRLESGRAGRDDRRVRRMPPLATVVPLAAALLLFASLVAYRQGALPQLSSSMTEVTRMKGARPHLTVYRKTAAGAEQLAAGQQARQRDVLQISYTAADARYGVILSLDGRGTVTWHYPPGGAAGPSPALARQGEVPLESAYELDDAPGFERFIFVYSQSAFDPRAVEQAVRALAARPARAEDAALALPKGLSQFSVSVKKQG